MKNMNSNESSPQEIPKLGVKVPLRTIIIEKNSLVLCLLFSSVLFHTELWFHPWFQQNWGAIAQVWGTLGFRGRERWLALQWNGVSQKTQEFGYFQIVAQQLLTSFSNYKITHP
jgi:hypothetical protein